MDQRNVKSVQTWVEVPFADGTYKLQLCIDEIKELQENCSAGIGAIYQRIATNNYYAHDLYETVRLGLIGGGTDFNKARRLVSRYAMPPHCPLSDLVVLALTILGACLTGVDVGKPTEEAVSDPVMDGSTSSPSTEQDAR